MLQGAFEYAQGNFSFAQNNKSKLLKFKVIKRCFLNNDFPDSVLHRLEQAFARLHAKEIEIQLLQIREFEPQFGVL